MKKYPSQEPALVKERNRLYREANLEKLRAYDAARYPLRYEASKAARATPEAREAARQRTREWRAKNPGRSREGAKKWAAEHPDYISPSQLDRERVNAQWRAMYARDPARHCTRAANKRARKRGIPGSHTEEEWSNLVAYFGGCCVYCGEPGKMTRDHVRPLSRPELNPTNDISNILPACLRCNSRKRDKADWEYRLWLSKRGPVCSQSA